MRSKERDGNHLRQDRRAFTYSVVDG